MHQWIGSALVQIIAFHILGAKPLSKPVLGYLDPWEQTSLKFESKHKTFHGWKCIWKCLWNGGVWWVKFILTGMVPLGKKDLFILCIEYCCCWCPGDARSHGISNHDNDNVLPDDSSFSTTRVKWISYVALIWMAKSNCWKMAHISRNWLSRSGILLLSNWSSVLLLSFTVNFFSWLHHFIVITWRLRQSGCHFPVDIFKWIFLNEIVWIMNKISLNFVPRGLLNNIPALVQTMTWCRPGDKLLSEPMMARLLTRHPASVG